MRGSDSAGRLADSFGPIAMHTKPTFEKTYRRDLPKASIHMLDAGHFALDTTADVIAALIRSFAA